MNTVKVFEINDCDWWAGSGTPKEILKAYMEATGVTHEEATGDEKNLPRELDCQEMQRLWFTHEDGTTVPFAKHLAALVAEGQKFPCCFASTEY